jgi:hypothetical protein
MFKAPSLVKADVYGRLASGRVLGVANGCLSASQQHLSSGTMEAPVGHDLRSLMIRINAPSHFP